MREIMKRAWEIKRENELNIFGLCLKMAWEESKNKAAVLTVEEYLTNKGYKVWEKAGKKRVYINSIASFPGFENYTTNPKGFRKVGMYYDIVEDAFYYDKVGNTSVPTINAFIAGIRSAC